MTSPPRRMEFCRGGGSKMKDRIRTYNNQPWIQLANLSGLFY
jgi:hypothetical protein